MKGRWALILLGTALIVALAGCGGGSGYATPASSGGASATSAPSGGGSAEVKIANFAFDPASLTVAAGTAVTWTNDDSTAHTVTSDAGDWESGQLSQGATFSHTFDQAGTFTYHCSNHPSMKGTIVVQ